MGISDKFNFLIFCMCIPYVVFVGNDISNSLEIMHASKQMIWDQFQNLISSEDVDPTDQSVEFIFSSGQKICASQTFARKLLSIDAFGRLQRSDDAYKGHHPVVRLKSLFFKSDVCLPPLDPMMETAVFFFHTLLFQEGIVPSDFVFVKNVNIARFPLGLWDTNQIQNVVLGQENQMLQQFPSIRDGLIFEKQNHLLQISQAIDGERGSHFISLVDQGKKSLDELEILDFQKHFLSNLVLNPGDHKSENFIITSHFSKNHLINIDNDGVFFHTVVSRDSSNRFSEIQSFGGCKCIIFLLKPLMNQSIDPSLKQKIQEMNVDEFITLWISLLDELNQKVLKTFKENPNFQERYKKNYLPFKLKEKTIARLKNEMKIIQEFFRTHSNCSCEDLFYFLRPDLAEYYSWMLSQHKTYERTLNKIYGNERPLSNGRAFGARIGPKPLKGRWIFEALRRYKENRNQDLKESLQEVDYLPYSSLEFFVPQPMNCKEILLKNSDDSLWKEWVSEDFLYALCHNQLPNDMQTTYPYYFLQNQVRLLLETEPNGEQRVHQELHDFSLTQNVYEDFVFYLLMNPTSENALTKGIKKCVESLKTNESIK